MESADGRLQHARAQMIFTSLPSLSGFERERNPSQLRGSRFDLAARRSLPQIPRGREALAAATGAVDTLIQLVDQYPDNIDYQLTLARAYRNASKVASRNRLPLPSRASIRQSVRMLDGLLREHPEAEPIRYELAKTLASSEVGGLDDMMHLTRARRLCDALLQENPDVIRYRALKAHALGRIAHMQQGISREDRAIRTLEDKIALERTLIRDAPDLPAYRIKLSQTLERLSDLNFRRGRPDAARDELSEAIEILREITGGSDPPTAARVQLQRLTGKMQQRNEPS
jgi:hypothetical protein